MAGYFLWIAIIQLTLTTVATNESVITVTYCIPCEEKYIINVDFKSSCDKVPHTKSQKEILSVGTDLKETPCLPCHSDFSARNLSQVCEEVLKQFKATEDDSDTVFTPPEECSLYHHEVFYNGSCKTLLDSSSCGEGEWLILVNETAECVKQKCPDGQIIFDNSCVEGRNNSVCGENQELVAYHDGSSGCECVKSYVKDHTTGTCHFRQSQGPCQPSWFIEGTVSDQTACIPNLCSNDSYVYVEGKCLLKDESIKFCEPENIRPTNNHTSVFCSNILHDIFSVGTMNCPAGHRKSHGGICTQIFKIRHKKPRRSYPIF